MVIGSFWVIGLFWVYIIIFPSHPKTTRSILLAPTQKEAEEEEVEMEEEVVVEEVEEEGPAKETSWRQEVATNAVELAI